MDIKNLKINNISYAIATVWGKIKGNITDQTDLKNADGTIETLLITSTDNTYPLELNKTYKLQIYFFRQSRREGQF